jgi:hypothetical protein
MSKQQRQQVAPENLYPCIRKFSQNVGVAQEFVIMPDPVNLAQRKLNKSTS